MLEIPTCNKKVESKGLFSTLYAIGESWNIIRLYIKAQYQDNKKK